MTARSARECNTREELEKLFREAFNAIEAGRVDVGRHHYARALGYAVAEAAYLGIPRMSAVELGVAEGNGLLELCRAAAFFQEISGIEILVYGFDSCVGLPAGRGYVDHPEIWQPGQCHMGDKQSLIARLPPFARLIEGDFATTIPTFVNVLGSSLRAPLGFVSLDVDYYTSSKMALRLFSGPADAYLPAVTMYADDVHDLITYNSWCGEARAIKEFNEEYDLRKIEEKRCPKIHNFYCCHVLDHPVRTGQSKPRFPFEIHMLW